MRTIVIIGAALAGLRAAEGLRQEGFDGQLVVVGSEEHLPYDRPPLSKQLLAGEWTFDRIQLRDEKRYEELDIEWHLGRTAVGLDLSSTRVALDDGTYIGFDGAVIATGAQPKSLPNTASVAGVYTLRTIEDCEAVASALEKPGARVVVVGAGFIGSEVAATCHGRGAKVTLVEALPTPLAHVLGDEMGAACATLHRDHGVDLRCGVGVARIEAGRELKRVVLDDGSAIDADIVVVGVGVSPATRWLESSELKVDDGVLCDEYCIAAPGVAAAGDVARWRHPRLGTYLRVEHWTNAAEQGAAAAHNLLAGPGGAEPYSPVPYFWSDQYEVKIQYVGVARRDDQVRVVHGSVDERRFVAVYGRAGRLTAALAFNRPRHLMSYRRLLAEGATWEDALAC